MPVATFKKDLEPEDLSGELVDHGRLKLLDILGSGAYGQVYKALDFTSPSRNPAYFAVKCMRKPARSHSRLAKLQKREISTHIQLSSHPNIVTFHRTFVDKVRKESYVFVVMDLCEGGDLFATIVEQRVFQYRDDLVKAIFVQLIDALHCCHQAGIFHRDIKPENYLVSKDGSTVYLADFGLSTKDAITDCHGIGSSYYMSPECIGKDFSYTPYSARESDIWSLGVILANMISGRNPWRYARSDDPCFHAFFKDDDFLLNVLPISEAANCLLKRIFVINPAARISLPNLRQAILEIDTFFLTEEELEHTSSQCQRNAKYYAEEVPEEEDKPTRSESTYGKTQRRPSSTDSREIYIFPSAIESVEPMAAEHAAQPALAAFRVAGDSDEETSSETSSDTSSEIATPDSAPTQDDVEVISPSNVSNLGRSPHETMLKTVSGSNKLRERRPTGFPSRLTSYSTHWWTEKVAKRFSIHRQRQLDAHV